MAFAVSSGSLVSLQKPTAQAPYALKISDDFTQDYAEIYKTQPAVRTVVDFLARNIAQLNIHAFRRISDTDRERLRDHPLAQLLGAPNSFTTPYRLKRDLVADRCIFDAAYWVKNQEAGQAALVRIPPPMIKPSGEDWLRPTSFAVEGDKGKTEIDARHVVYFRGYNPTNGRSGLSPIETLRRILAEEYAAGQMREQVLRNGARVSGYIERPADPQGKEWDPAARNRFRSAWRAQYNGGSATEAGGTPVLEDGMKFVAAAHSAVDLQYVESRKLTREEVAAAYFIPPPMVGILDHATFSNITEQHKMLYQDTLGPWLADIQQEIALQLLPEFPDTDRVYVEFNMEEKLRGSFEEQAAQLQSSVGAPYMTRNEARARANLPSVPGGDILLAPLNMLEVGATDPVAEEAAPGGELSSPRPTRKARPLEKARATSQQRVKARKVIGDFFAKQEQSIRSVLGAKADADWWNGDRWDTDLAAILFALSSSITEDVARKQLDALGADPDEYDVDRTLAYLQKVAKSNATSINAVTRIKLEDALAEAEEPLAEVGHVFDVAKGARSDELAQTITTSLAGFATVEAATQVSGGRGATKTWITTSSNPRSTHASMNGETVAIDAAFSNGANWPGDSSALDVDDVAGCMCDVVIDFE
ncbi:phage portal protein [Rathayibacter sp. VKM Ac-2804]|uniref:phage portal protein n=1 Tax=Rathayibacter sp. VKM Ac-2804 TaxID=2609257 RepID=UPI001ABE9427|nr:phage portal protein [Rathayibacter sp. VKM Ac-2804]